MLLSYLLYLNDSVLKDVNNAIFNVQRKCINVFNMCA